MSKRALLVALLCASPAVSEPDAQRPTVVLVRGQSVLSVTIPYALADVEEASWIYQGLHRGALSTGRMPEGVRARASAAQAACDSLGLRPSAGSEGDACRKESGRVIWQLYLDALDPDFVIHLSAQPTDTEPVDRRMKRLSGTAFRGARGTEVRRLVEVGPPRASAKIVERLLAGAGELQPEKRPVLLQLPTPFRSDDTLLSGAPQPAAQLRTPRPCAPRALWKSRLKVEPEASPAARSIEVQYAASVKEMDIQSSAGAESCTLFLGRHGEALRATLNCSFGGMTTLLPKQHRGASPAALSWLSAHFVTLFARRACSAKFEQADMDRFAHGIVVEVDSFRAGKSLERLLAGLDPEPFTGRYRKGRVQGTVPRGLFRKLRSGTLSDGVRILRCDEVEPRKLKCEWLQLARPE